MKTENLEMERDGKYSARETLTSVSEGKLMKTNAKLFNSPLQISVCLNTLVV